MYVHNNRRTCSRRVGFDIVDGKLHNVIFDGGCGGNTQGLARLLEGMDAAEAADRLQGVDCGGRGTSCPDQLAEGIRQALAQQA